MSRSQYRVAYLTNQYPKVSHSFIRREILAMETAGVAVSRFALRGWDGDVVAKDDLAERDRTTYTLKDGIGPLVLGTVRAMIRRPGRFLSALRTALAMSVKSTRPMPFHLVYLAHACRLLTWLEKAPVDHLHVHFGTNAAEVALLLNLLGGPPYSFTIHGPDEIDDAKLLGLDRKVSKAKFVVAISKYTRSQIFRHVDHTHWDKIRVVHCGLPDAAFSQDPPPYPDTPALLCVGRLSEQKGHLVLLEAFAEVLDHLPDAKLVLAGDGELRDLIEERMAALGIAQSVRITGWVSPEQVRAELAACRILVQPSLMEGLPVVIMEAMAQHRPVISTFVAGIPELVLPNATGWLVPAGSTTDLALAMRAALASSDEDLRAMGAAGYDMVRKTHHIGTEAGKLHELFRDGAP